MEGLLAQRTTPLLKCAVLFLFIFTAKVLTSRPQDSQDVKSIHQAKTSNYIRTFTKYHHRRIQSNAIPEYWTIEHPKVVQKRSVDDEDASEFISNNSKDISVNTFTSNSLRDISLDKNAISSKEVSRNEVSKSNDVKKYKDKEALPTSTAPSVKGAKIICIYKTNHVAMRVTPSYEDDEQNAQLMVENDGFDAGPISEVTLPTGEVVQAEQCTDSRAYCYTLWHQITDGNITVLGQGCWRGSRAGGCRGCTRVTPRLPATKFCCCDTPMCNQDFASHQEETMTMKVESPTDATPTRGYVSVAASASLALLAFVLIAFALHRMYCTRRDDDGAAEAEKVGDIMGSGPDSLATGLLCVDNLTLIEHIGQGKFGSVWRGCLGSTPVAVKLYSNATAWQKEAAIYALPHLSHPNILRYYGSDTRQTLTEASAREHLIVLELCDGTLRSRLEQAPLTWVELATLAHGLAAALAHLHTPSGAKPCIVHRDVNSRNVLCVNGTARLADLGLAQPLPQRRDRNPRTITEAGTLRYLSPEALEGALDLSEARAALCAVDVYALGLVLWEMLWRCSGAHSGPVPAYAQPYHTVALPYNPTLPQMQSVVSRSKSRPPLPRGPGSEPRALRTLADTCDECWDHDAEARLTAVCVEARMAELKQMLQPHGPLVHDNNLHPHGHTHDHATSVPEDKNSNCTSAQNSDVTTPLLYPHPHIGRNACIERNTHNQTPHQVELIHKSLKDISAPADQPRVQNVGENCLSVARVNHSRPAVLDYENSDRLNEIRSYQRPLDYIPNDVSTYDVDRRPKQTNLLHDVRVEKPKWGIRRFFERKLNRNPKALDTEVKLLPEVNNAVQNGRIRTSVVAEKPSNLHDRPANLVLNENGYNFDVPCTLSPPNRTLSPTMMLDSLNRETRVFNFKELPPSEETRAQNQIFAVIVPKVKPNFTNLIEIRSKKGTNSSESVKNSVRTSMSSQSIFKSDHSESSDSTKKRLSCDNRIISNNSGRSSRASINLELQYIGSNDSPYDLNTDSSSEDEQLLLLSENGGSKITMQTVSKQEPKRQDVLKEASYKTELGLNKINKYANFDNEFSDPHDKENLLNYSGDNPVYLAALNGDIPADPTSPKSPKPSLKNLAMKRKHSLEEIGEIFSSAGDLHLQNPAGRVKTPGDIPVAIRRARSRALQKGRANESNRLSLYDDRMMFGNSL